MLSNDTLSRSISGLAECARQHGLMVCSAEVIDGMNACGELIPRTLPELRDALAPCFVKSFDDLALFDDVFRAYFNDEKVAALSAVLGTEVRRLQARKKTTSSGNAATNRDQREESTPQAGWLAAILSDQSLPKSFKAFLERDPHSAAARLMREPLIEADKKSIVTAFSRAAAKVAGGDLAKIQASVQGYLQLSAEVRVRCATHAGPQAGVHARHSGQHTWSSPAYFIADQAPRELLDAQLATADKDPSSSPKPNGPRRR